MLHDANSKSPKGDVQQPSESFRVHDRIGEKYTLIRPLSEGAMGSLWVARNDLLDTEVALKLVNSNAVPAAAARFLDEARAAARLDHPAIVRVFDVGLTPKGMPYIVMELLHGVDFNTALTQRERLGATKAIRMLLPIADALCSAHARGIIHRDIKPGNIFLAQNEDQGLQPKLVDFGVAKLMDRSSGLTQVGSVLGTPAYMAPEQVFGRTVDHRVDVWALCVTLYETITGRLPFNGETYMEVMHAIAEKPPTPTTVFGAGDPALWTILERGFAKKREERWPSMHALGTELAGWLLHNGFSDDICGKSLRATWFNMRQQRSWKEVLSSPPPPAPPVGSAALQASMPTMDAPRIPQEFASDSMSPPSSSPISLRDACESDPAPPPSKPFVFHAHAPKPPPSDLEVPAAPDNVATNENVDVDLAGLPEIAQRKRFAPLLIGAGIVLLAVLAWLAFKLGS